MKLIFPILWTTFIIIASTLSKSNADKLMLNVIGFDKIAHFISYGLLSFLWVAYFQKRELTKKMFWTIGLACIVLGIFLEFMQTYLNAGRSLEFADMIANSLGTILGLYSFNIYKKRKE